MRHRAQIGQVVGDDLNTQQAHLVGRLLAPMNGLGRLTGITGISEELSYDASSLITEPLTILTGD